MICLGSTLCLPLMCCFVKWPGDDNTKIGKAQVGAQAGVASAMLLPSRGRRGRCSCCVWCAGLRAAGCGGSLEGSHRLSMQKVLQELQARGHQTVVLVIQQNQSQRRGPFHSENLCQSSHAGWIQHVLWQHHQTIFETQSFLKRFWKM